MIRSAKSLAAVACIALTSTSAAALSLADSSGIVGNSHVRVAGVYSVSKITYEVDGENRDVDRRIVGTELSRGVGNVDVFAQVGLITSSLMEDVRPDGTGYVFGAGMRGQVFHRDRTSVLLDALYTRQRERLTGVDLSVLLDSYDVHAGVTLKQAYNSAVQPYIGVEVVPSNGGRQTIDPKGQKAASAGMARDGILNVRGGCLFQVSTGLSIRPELAAGGEATASITGGYSF